MPETLSPSTPDHREALEIQSKRLEILRHAEQVLETLGDLRIAGSLLREPQKMAAVSFVEWIRQSIKKETAMGHIVAPTGIGKTHMAVLFTLLAGGKTVYFTLSNHLGIQASQAYREGITGSSAESETKKIGRCFGGHHEPDADIVIGNFNAFPSWEPEIDWKKVHAIIVDEADVNALSEARVKVLKDLAQRFGIPVIGMSATEEQASGKKLQEVFRDEILYLPMPRTLPLLLEMGLIPKITFQDIYLDLRFEVDRKKLRSEKKLNPIAVQEFIRSTTWNELLLDHYQEHFSLSADRFTPTLFVFRNNALVDDFVTQAGNKGIKAARFTGEESKEELEALKEKMSRKELHALAGSRLLGRGLDIVEIECIYNCQMTYSPQLFWQAFGRAVRLDLANPQKIAHVMTVLPRYLIDQNEGRPLTPQERPLCYASFFSEHYYPPICKLQSALTEGKIPEDESPLTLDLSQVKTIRTCVDVRDIVKKFYRKPPNFLGKPGLMARAIAHLQELNYRQLLSILRAPTFQLLPFIEALERESMGSEDPSTNLFSYSHEEELSRSEERELIEQYLLGKDSPHPELQKKSKEACAKLCKAYEPLLKAMARRLSPMPSLEEDLVQEGMEQFLTSLQQFNPLYKCRLVKYCIKTIFLRMKRLAHEMEPVLRVPSHAIIKFKKIEAFKEEFLDRTGFLPTPEEIRMTVHCDKETLSASCREFRQEEGVDVEEIAVSRELDPLEGAEKGCLKDDLQKLLKTIPYREREILKLRYGLMDDYTYSMEEIGAIFRVCRSRIRQIEISALLKLASPPRIDRLRLYL